MMGFINPARSAAALAPSHCGKANDMPDESHPTSKRESLSHDLRHSLFALRTGIDLLPHVQQDPAHFSEVHRLLQKEISQASELLAELLGSGKEQRH